MYTFLPDFKEILEQDQIALGNTLYNILSNNYKLQAILIKFDKLGGDIISILCEQDIHLSLSISDKEFLERTRLEMAKHNNIIHS